MHDRAVSRPFDPSVVVISKAVICNENVTRKWVPWNASGAIGSSAGPVGRRLAAASGTESSLFQPQNPPTTQMPQDKASLPPIDCLHESRPPENRRPRFSAPSAVLAALGLILSTTPWTAAEEQALAPLKQIDAGTKKSTKRTYVAIKGGTTTGQSGELTIGDDALDLLEYDGAFVFGIEVGYAWRMKRLPFESSLEFEGGFLSSELNGALGADMLGTAAPEDIIAVQTDLNAAFFMLNGALTLDLWRYRARLGRVITRLRPYIGGGIGGSQLWFRNTETVTADPNAVPTENPFATDEFVFAYQWFGGLEVMVNEKVSLFGEYRELTFEDFENVTDLKHSGWQLGIRVNYDKPVQVD